MRLMAQERCQENGLSPTPARNTGGGRRLPGDSEALLPREPPGRAAAGPSGTGCLGEARRRQRHLRARCLQEQVTSVIKSPLCWGQTSRSTRSALTCAAFAWDGMGGRYRVGRGASPHVGIRELKCLQSC